MNEQFLVQASQGKRSSETSSAPRAAIYARTSSASQRFGYSIGEQVRQCLDQCQLMSWEPVFIFRDEAKSGKDTDRPMFQKMLTNAEQGTFDVLVFWKLDRFSRSIMHAVRLENEFREFGVALHSVTEQLDTTTAAGRFNFRNIANAAEFERDLIKQRTKMGHTALALEHKWPNSTPPLGYERLDDGLLAIYPSEASTVRWIFKTYLQEQSMPKVAQMLNTHRRPRKKNSEWNPASVGNVLRNSIYVGEYSVGEVTEVAEEYRILSDDLFSRVTAVRHRFKRARNARRPPMGRERKQSRVEKTLDQYLEFCS